MREPDMVIVPSVGGILVLLVVLAVVIFLVSRGRRGKGWPRRLRHRHPVTRVVCAVLGLGVLVAVGIGTWRDLAASGASPEAAAGLKVRVPSQFLVPPPDAAAQGGEAKEARLLGYLVAADVSGGRAVPTAVQPFELHWPEDRDRTTSTEITSDDYSMSLDVSLNEVRWEPTTSDDRVKLMLRAQAVYTANYASGSRRRSQSGIPTFYTPWGHELFDVAAPREPSPLSIVTQTPDRRTAFSWLVLAGSPDDPLQEISGREFVDRYGNLLRFDSPVQFLTAGGWAETGELLPGGPALAMHIGVSSLVLFVAAVLIAQVFKRRGLTFAAALAAVVLYVAVLDRAVLSVRLGHMNDIEATVYSRRLACGESFQTFFFRDTAAREVRAMAADPATPEKLRTYAQQALDGLCIRR